MDVFPKFIIETDPEDGDVLVIAKCTFHKELAEDVTKVKGGGWWRLDRDTNTFVLHGESHDFGKAKQQDIADCVSNGNVYSNKYRIRNISDKYNFAYQNEVGEIFPMQFPSNDR